jgi:hypothetical protein
VKWPLRIYCIKAFTRHTYVGQMTDKMGQTQLMHVIYLEDVATSCKQITRRLDGSDSIYLSFVILSKRMGMAHVPLRTVHSSI